MSGFSQVRTSSFIYFSLSSHFRSASPKTVNVILVSASVVLILLLCCLLPSLSPSLSLSGWGPLPVHCPDLSAAVGWCCVTELQATTRKDLPTGTTQPTPLFCLWMSGYSISSWPHITVLLNSNSTVLLYQERIRTLQVPRGVQNPLK